MRFLQLNLNHYETAQYLLQRTNAGNKINVAILSEEYRNLYNASQISDESSRADNWMLKEHHIQKVMQTAQNDCGFIVEDIHNSATSNIIA